MRSTHFHLPLRIRLSQRQFSETLRAHERLPSSSMVLRRYVASQPPFAGRTLVVQRNVDSRNSQTVPSRPFSSEMTHQRIKGRRRFYRHVTVREKDAAEEFEEGARRWEVLLDNRVLKTPARKVLEFDSLELAMAVAAEWDAQTTSKGLEPAVMPLMGLASTAIDQVAPDRERTISTCLKYLPTDTVCFLSPDPDPVLTRRQRQLWSPLREWSDQGLGIPVTTTTEIFRKPEHPAESLVRARDLLESLDEWALAAVQSVTMECKSLLIALALVFRKTTVSKAFDAARLEEEYNVERWGMIEGGHDMDRSNTTLTLTAASTLVWLRSSTLPQLEPAKR